MPGISESICIDRRLYRRNLADYVSDELKGATVRDSTGSKNRYRPLRFWTDWPTARPRAHCKIGIKEAIRLRAIVVRHNGNSYLMKRMSLLGGFCSWVFRCTITIDHDSTNTTVNAFRSSMHPAPPRSTTTHTASPIPVVDNIW